MQSGLDVTSPATILLDLLWKIDRLDVPQRSRREVEQVLVRRVTRELDILLPWQRGHGRRTAVVAQAIGKAVGWTADDLHDLTLAAYLHDIGQLAFPHEHSSRICDSDTYAAIQSHPRLGARMIEPIRFLQKAAVLVAHHHERWDGAGYPYGIRGPYIPVGARILAIADAFDAIRVPEVSCRWQRARIALRILRVGAGTQFDPMLVDVLSWCLHREARGEMFSA